MIEANDILNALDEIDIVLDTTSLEIHTYNKITKVRSLLVLLLVERQQFEKLFYEQQQKEGIRWRIK